MAGWMSEELLKTTKRRFYLREENEGVCVGSRCDWRIRSVCVTVVRPLMQVTQTAQRQHGAALPSVSQWRRRGRSCGSRTSSAGHETLLPVRYERQ